MSWLSLAEPGPRTPIQLLHHRRTSSANSFRIELTVPSPTTSAPPDLHAGVMAGPRIVLDRLAFAHLGEDEDRRGRWANIRRRLSGRLVAAMVVLLVVAAMIRLSSSPSPSGWITSWPSRRAVINDPPSRPLFLLPIRITQSEPDAQRHLYQLGLLATALNRTLVLPNVRDGRFSACHSKPFSDYYEDDSLRRSGIDTMSQEDFDRWADGRDRPLDGQLLILRRDEEPSAPTDGRTAAELRAEGQDLNRCLYGGLSIRHRRHLPLIFTASNDIDHNFRVQGAFAGDIFHAMRTRMSTASRVPDVLLVDYDLRHDLTTPEEVAGQLPSATKLLPFEPFPYATTLVDAAATIARQISPFVVVQRREKETREPCRSVLQELRKNEPAMASVVVTRHGERDEKSLAFIRTALGLPSPFDFERVVEMDRSLSTLDQAQRAILHSTLVTHAAGQLDVWPTQAGLVCGWRRASLGNAV